MRNQTEQLIWVIIGIIAIIAVLSLVPPLLYRGSLPLTGYGMMGGYPYYGMYIFMPVMAIVSVLVIFLFIYFLTESVHETGFTHDHGDLDALEILRRRYARGEINENEYREKLKELRGN